jgi:HEAT repeat protein
LGRLGDADAVPLLGRILADGRDFYIVYSVAAQALGRIGGSGALRALEPAFAENEVNTHFRAQAAKEYIERTC